MELELKIKSGNCTYSPLNFARLRSNTRSSSIGQLQWPLQTITLFDFSLSLYEIMLHLLYQRQRQRRDVARETYARNVPKLFPIYNSYKNGLPRLLTMMCFFPRCIYFIVSKCLCRTTCTHNRMHATTIAADTDALSRNRCDHRWNIMFHSAYAHRVVWALASVRRSKRMSECRVWWLNMNTNY